jgi:transposase
MDSKELYVALLGLKEPWQVEDVAMDLVKQEVVVTVAHAPRRSFCCPRCQRELPVSDHAPQRRWRHLDSCQFMTFLEARTPRVDCPEHGKLQVQLPWAEPGSRFTAMFEALAIQLLQAANVKRAAQLLRLSWDEAWGVMRRAVRRGLAAKADTAPRVLGVDEKAIAKGHRYMTLVCDLDAATVEYVGEERTQKSLTLYYEGLTEKQRQGIEAVSMDMWEPYILATTKALPQARDKIVFDRFHIMQTVLRALDLVRRKENKELRGKGDQTLARTKYLWLRSEENLTAAASARFCELKALNLKTARAWALKESLRALWAYRRRAWALRYWKRWYYWATHSQLPPMIEAARTINRHLHNVLTYFTHRITNAVAEGLNSKIGTVQKRACGFRNRDHFKIAIYFHCGGLDLYPSRVTPAKV